MSSRKTPSKTKAAGKATPRKVARNIGVKGFRAFGVASGIKKGGKKDLALILSDVPARVAGVCTTNRVKAAPVVINSGRLKRGVSSGVIVNSGNANACTGKRGLADALKMAALAEKASGVPAGEMLVASTGVIGVGLPIEKVEEGLGRLVKGLRATGWHEAARAIMTTDTYPKTALASARVEGRRITIAGIAKGAGMICPDMATMLAFFATDANITLPALKRALTGAVDGSFNCISVDNDTSTNDTVLIFANGLASGGRIGVGSRGFKTFVRLLSEVSLTLAHMIVEDGEGTTRFLEFHIKGAASQKDARSAARTLAGSLLVKTAFFGGDPNWGRLMAALGRSGVRMSAGKVNISFNNVPVVRRGLDTGRQRQAASALRSRRVNVTIDLKTGRSSHKHWTTDLSTDYVRRNSSYRT
jgi:glutamate N-acetyltransferase/amino-acid N-acetyltransferase